MEPKLRAEIEHALGAVGELLAAEGAEVGIIVVGGTALNLLGIVERATRDVDVLAIVRGKPQPGGVVLAPPDPLPDPLRRAIATVARDFRLSEDWMNTVVGLQWQTGLPPGLERRLHWRRYRGLTVGLADRYDLIFLKLYAAADSGGPSSVHFQDLVALRPAEGELNAAAHWAREQDPTPAFSVILEQVIQHVRKSIR
jgi:hypothetical protein